MARYLPCVAIAVTHACAVAAVARSVPRDQVLHNRTGDWLLHGFLETLDSAPPLARWDSIWYYGIAVKGYVGEGGEAPLTGGFAPLYGVLMRYAAVLAGSGYFTAGTWISVTATLAAVLQLAAYVPEREGEGAATWPAVATLFAFPLAFIFISVYSEALFLASALAAFVWARRGRQAPAAAAAFAAGLTRIHGIALVPALAVLGWEQWRAQHRALASAGSANGIDDQGAPGARSRPLAGVAAFLPALGSAGAYLALGADFWARTGNPLFYFAAKRLGWQQRFSPPWKTIATAIDHLDASLEHPSLGTILTALELPCFCLIVAAVPLLWLRAWRPEATFVACAGAITFCSGWLAGLPRYTLVLFPIFVLLARLRSRPVLWSIYLIVGITLQACLVINFVRFGHPAP